MQEATKRGPGRPPIDPSERRGKRLSVLLKAADLATMTKVATSYEMTLSSWAESVLTRAVAAPEQPSEAYERGIRDGMRRAEETIRKARS